MGTSQSFFSDMVTELGLSAAMQPETEYTILAPLNGAFSGELTHDSMGKIQDVSAEITVNAHQESVFHFSSFFWRGPE